jgi:hypothetical protein
MTLTKFADELRGVNTAIADISAITSKMTTGQKQALYEVLAKDLHAASATDAPKRRLASVSAAAESTNQRIKTAYINAKNGLAALGLSVDAVATSGDLSQVDKLMKERAWAQLRRIELKNSLGIIGCIA